MCSRGGVIVMRSGPETEEQAGSADVLLVSLALRAQGTTNRTEVQP
jgi:hypothetical protein